MIDHNAARAAIQRNDAAALNAALGSTRQPVLKPVKAQLKLDDYTREQIESAAATSGCTFDEEASRWLRQHAIYFGYRS